LNPERNGDVVGIVELDGAVSGVPEFIDGNEKEDEGVDDSENPINCEKGGRLWNDDGGSSKPTDDQSIINRKTITSFSFSSIFWRAFSGLWTRGTP